MIFISPSNSNHYQLPGESCKYSPFLPKTTKFSEIIQQQFNIFDVAQSQTTVRSGVAMMMNLSLVLQVQRLYCE